MAWSAVSRRTLLAASPIASVEPTAIGERITEWLKITAVPLLVFLVGACIWGCIQNTATWRGFTEYGGGSTHNAALGEVRSDSFRAISNNEAAIGEQVGEQIAWSSIERLRCSEEASLILAHHMKSSVFQCSIERGLAADLEAALELSQVRCRDEESDRSLKSNACSIATKAGMDGNARPNSDIGDADGR